jgi:anti-sigma regulatory factor (Ser/Thr protein kinase)
MKAQMQIDIAIDEIVANVSFYAYTPGTGNIEICFDYEPENRTAVIMFKDRGVPFNPLEKDEPDTGLTAEEREIGGLGIFLVRKTMDSMEYRHEDGCNILTIRKKIG